jgi:hypothetical protein
MISGTFTMTISGVEVTLTVSTVSATLVQLAAWDQLWARLLAGVSAVPAASGTCTDTASGVG